MQKKYIGEGINGRCYEIENGEVLKVFKIKPGIEELKRYKSFLEYSNDSILFPYRFITTKKYIKAYVSKKAPGEKIYNCLGVYGLDKISKDLIKLEKDVLIISKGNIVMYDNHSENMLYDGNKFSVIDVDDYSFYDCPNNFDYTYPYDRNVLKIEGAIFEIFCNEIGKTNLSIKDKNKLFEEFRKYLFWNQEPSYQVFKYKNILEKFLNEKIYSLESVKKITKV